MTHLGNNGTRIWTQPYPTQRTQAYILPGHTPGILCTLVPGTFVQMPVMGMQTSSLDLKHAIELFWALELYLKNENITYFIGYGH